MRLIDADALPRLMQIFEANGKRREQEVVLSKIIDNAPTIDTVRHGRWILTETALNEYANCSECGAQVMSDEAWHYCPHCGARMDGGSDV